MSTNTSAFYIFSGHLHKLAPYFNDQSKTHRLRGEQPSSPWIEFNYIIAFLTSTHQHLINILYTTTATTNNEHSKGANNNVYFNVCAYHTLMQTRKFCFTSYSYKCIISWKGVEKSKMLRVTIMLVCYYYLATHNSTKNYTSSFTSIPKPNQHNVNFTRF